MTEEKFQNLKKESPPKTETEYWRLHKMFSRHITKMYSKIFKFPTQSKQFIEDYKELLSEGVRLELITEEYKQEKINKLYKEMTSPSRFKQDVTERLQKAKDKLIRKGKLKENDKKD